MPVLVEKMSAGPTTMSTEVSGFSHILSMADIILLGIPYLDNI